MVLLDKDGEEIQSQNHPKLRVLYRRVKTMYKRNAH